MDTLGGARRILAVHKAMKSLITVLPNQTVLSALEQEQGTNVYNVWNTYTTLHL